MRNGSSEKERAWEIRRAKYRDYSLRPADDIVSWAAFEREFRVGRSDRILLWDWTQERVAHVMS